MRAKIKMFLARCVALIISASLLTFGYSVAYAQQSGAGPSSDRKWNYSELKKAPQKARVKQNPYEHDSVAVLAGGKLFQEHCAECHGLKAEGGKHGPSLLRDEVQQAPAGSLFWILSNGVIWHGMPDWSKLPDEQRWQIVTFLKTFQAPPAGQNTDRAK